MKLLLYLKCFILGHPTISTGRHGLTLREHLCTRCGSYFITSEEHPRALLRASGKVRGEFEEIIKITHNTLW